MRFRLPRLSMTISVITQTDDEVLSRLVEAKPCETSLERCDREATWMIWVDHHVQGCPSSSYRCDVHWNLLHLELQRLLGLLRRGVWVTCRDCGVLVTSQNPDDHVRGIRL